MVRDDMESVSKAIMHASIRVLPADEWRQEPYLGSSGDSFWRKAEAFVPETEISAEPLSLVPEVPPEEADLIPPCFVLQFRVERGDIPSYFINYEATSQALVYWHDWIEAVLVNPDSVQILKASRALELVRLSMELSIRKNNTNIDLMVSCWRLGRAHAAKYKRDGGFRPLESFSGGCKASGLTEMSIYRGGQDLPPPGPVPPVGQAIEFNGKMLGSDLHLVEGVTVPASALYAFVAACPCSLPALCVEGARSVLYRPDKVARLFGNDQGAPGPTPPLKSYIEIIQLSAVSDIYHRDISLRSPKARQFGWHGKSSYWASSTAIPATTRGITIAEPISTVLPLRVTRAKAKEAARTPRSKEAPLSVVSADPLLRYEGGKHAPLSKLKRKRIDVGPRVHEEVFDSSIDDTIPINQSFKLPRVAQRSPSGKSIAKDNKVIDLDEGGSEGTGSDIENSDAHGIVQLVVEEDEEDDDISGLILHRRVSTERFLTVPDINLLALEAAIQHSLYDSRHGDGTRESELRGGLRGYPNDSLISLRTPQMGYVVSEFGEESSLLAWGPLLQQTKAGTIHVQKVDEDDSDVCEVEPHVVNEEELLSNEAFFGHFCVFREATSFLTFVRDRFPYTFFKVRDLYSQTMGRLQLHCLYTFLQGIRKIQVGDLCAKQVEEIGLTVQNFDKLGFDIWWVSKELKAAKIMYKNEQRVQNAVVAAKEEVVEERRKTYEDMAEKARIGERLIDIPLYFSLIAIT
ncbi:hypothetical protein RHSIM_Rhsim09G0061600 [Rhododendron simsii]|uniref:Uncharacterized protein n=1 Tax=Rhododendron simsii TaxID=118357 RepID=A0A834GE46_RHOSS|nr:hypothetical protein RHSIM_Rhsim09G0061600 [Rhododendron simsii]